MDATCSFPGCDRPRRSRTMEICGGHYSQRHRGEELRPLNRPPARSPLVECDGRMVRICEAPDCDSPGRNGTARYCAKHATRLARYGDVNAFVPIDERRYTRGPAHWLWADEPSYNAFHIRLRRTLGSATRHTCSCGAAARHWAYAGPRKPGERFPIGPVTEYQPMCVPCHTRFDYAAIRNQEAS